MSFFEREKKKSEKKYSFIPKIILHSGDYEKFFCAYVIIKAFNKYLHNNNNLI